MSLEDYIKKPLSNHDLNYLLDNKCSIIAYPEIKKYNSLDQLLYPHDCCIILYKSRPSFGHWCVIIKIDDNKVEYFNPYGGLVDNSLDFLNSKFRKESGQDHKYLSQLMIDSPYELFYNEFPFQETGKNINTCGRHCGVRALMKNSNIYEYKNMLDMLCKVLNCNYDELVTILTMK